MKPARAEIRSATTDSRAEITKSNGSTVPYARLAGQSRGFYIAMVALFPLQ